MVLKYVSAVHHSKMNCTLLSPFLTMRWVYFLSCSSLTAIIPQFSGALGVGDGWAVAPAPHAPLPLCFKHSLAFPFCYEDHLLAVSKQGLRVSAVCLHAGQWPPSRYLFWWVEPLWMNAGLTKAGMRGGREGERRVWCFLLRPRDEA